MQERRSKLVSIHDAIAQIPDGAKVAIGGSLIRRAPMALVREIVRQKKKDLTLYSWSAGMDFDMLIGGGCVKEAWSSYVGLVPAWHCRKLPPRCGAKPHPFCGHQRDLRHG